jgi:DNA polymerase
MRAECRCPLAANKLVFSDGNPDADLMFIGEAPGEHEDLQGIPFVGQAGQLLTKIIEAMGLRRADVYIANICKFRPPKNRLPTPAEVDACLPYLRRQIEIVHPKIIVTLGNLSTRTLLQTEEGITKIRGAFTDFAPGIQLMPTFHPSYLLRDPRRKADVWEDMKLIHARMRELGLKIGDLRTGKG